MNTLQATVTKIDTINNLNIVEFECSNQTLSMMSLDLNSAIKLGTKVELTIKSTHISLAKNFSGILSEQNQLKAVIKSIEHGKLLTNINLQIGDFIVESIVISSSILKMDLKIDDEVTVFIQASELSILRVL